MKDAETSTIPPIKTPLTETLLMRLAFDLRLWRGEPSSEIEMGRPAGLKPAFTLAGERGG